MFTSLRYMARPGVGANLGRNAHQAYRHYPMRQRMLGVRWYGDAPRDRPERYRPVRFDVPQVQNILPPIQNIAPRDLAPLRNRQVRVRPVRAVRAVRAVRQRRPSLAGLLRVSAFRDQLTRAVRPHWRQAETTALERFRAAGYTDQASFLHGRPVPWGRQGSTRPDLMRAGGDHGPGIALDVKNYDLHDLRSVTELGHIVKTQTAHRERHLPPGTEQGVVLDHTGRTLTPEYRAHLHQWLVRRSQGRLAHVHFHDGNQR